MTTLQSKPSVRDFKEWLKQKAHEDKGNDGLSREKDSSIASTNSSIERDHSYPDIFEHTLTIEQLADQFPLSRINVGKPERSLGLNKDEAYGKLESTGKNVISQKDSRSTLCLFAKQFLQTFRFLLLVTALLCSIIYILDTTKVSQLYLAVIIFAVLIAMSLLSYHQERSAVKQVSGFQTMLSTSCIVVREGTSIRVASETLVVGDLVKIRPGTRVSADIRLLHATSLRLDTSWITGELEPLPFFEDTSERETPALEAQNIALNGCQCISGEAIGVVIKTGNETILGRLFQRSCFDAKHSSRLSRDHSRFCRFIAILSVLMATITFCIGITITHLNGILNVFINGFLIVIVANVPQGLPVTLTAQLVIVARKLANLNLFLKKLDVSETLGTTSVLLCDKTGVMTDNNIVVTHLWYNGRTHSVEDLLPLVTPLIERPQIESYEGSLRRALQTMALCNRAQLENLITVHRDHTQKTSFLNQTIRSIRELTNGDAQKKMSRVSDYEMGRDPYYPSFTGHPTDKAILRVVQDLTSVIDLRAKWDIVFEVPFNKSRRWSIVIAREFEDARAEEDEIICFYAFLKGAPEDVIEKCSHVLESDEEMNIDELFLIKFKEAYTQFARNGQSCIALAMGNFEAAAGTEFSNNLRNFLQDGFTLVGMCGMSDPPRVETRKHIQTITEAQIKMHMVTGDHPRAAASVAELVGMGLQAEVCVVSGDVLASLSVTEWDVLLSQSHVVFARTSPEQKEKIVEECIKRGETVCATGDGLLDAPALRAAHIGIAIEAAGGIFAKEAADVLVTGGNLRHIVSGIEYGRLLFENLKKTIAYTLAHLLPELFPVVLTFVMGWPLALSTMQVLTIDLLTELPPSISLIYESPERDLMKKAPRKSSQHLVSRSLLVYSYLFAGSILTIGCLLAYLSVFWHYGISISELNYSMEKHWTHGSEKLLTQAGFLYDGKNQEKIHRQASAAYQIALVGAQMIHLLNCRTRRLSLFTHNLPKIQTAVAILLSLLLLSSCIYVPGMNQIVGVEAPPTFVWMFPLVTGVALTIFNEIRKYFIRRAPKHRFVRLIKW
ncbi:unnamed protein product, partial [Mesorhabditis belari]|uniref:Cation-transporting P-type ATPase N-terminal domain-containing protein n=1 Tax=Mesorhabditis belari TaxID=2138241 RepID=A0AAF3EAA4_9BILA